MIILNVNTDAAVIFTNKLEKLNRSAFPVAVRTALNSAAFDVKMNQLKKTVNKNFVRREPNFFRVNSKVEKATGWYLDEMQAMVGFIDLGGNNYAVDDLEQQEHGGVIGGKSFIPMNTARVEGNRRKLVQDRNRIRNVRAGSGIVATSMMSGKSEGHKFNLAINRVGVGGRVLSKFKGKRILWRVNSLNRSESGRFDLTGLYSFKKNRRVKVSSTNFMKEASEVSAKRMDEFYIAAAERQFEKALQ